MHVFEHLPISTLKKIIREYNLHVKISGYSKMTQSELVEALKKHLVISDDGVMKIKEIKNVGKVSDFEKKPREKKEKVKKVVPKPVEEKNVNKVKEMVKEIEKKVEKKDEKKKVSKVKEMVKEIEKKVEKKDEKKK
jgi:flagellar basal body rod protein FlgF